MLLLSCFLRGCISANYTLFTEYWWGRVGFYLRINEPRHEISNYVVCATDNGSDQPAHTRSLNRIIVSRLNIIWLLSYRPNSIWKAAQARLSLHFSKCHIVRNLMSWLNWYLSHRRTASDEPKAYAQSRQSLSSSHAESIRVKEGLDQKTCIDY